MPKIGDYKQDPDNANLGTERGARLLLDSLKTNGAGRSILVDKNGYIIAGNKTAAEAAAAGMREVIEVVTDGSKLVAVQRLDLDMMADPQATRLAIADNRIGELDLAWAMDVLQDIQAKNPEILDGFFSEEEIGRYIASMEPQLEEDKPDKKDADDREPRDMQAVTFTFYGDQAEIVKQSVKDHGGEEWLKLQLMDLMSLPEV
jgi:hypothetical protein